MENNNSTINSYNILSTNSYKGVYTYGIRYAAYQYREIWLDVSTQVLSWEILKACDPCKLWPLMKSMTIVTTLSILTILRLQMPGMAYNAMSVGRYDCMYQPKCFPLSLILSYKWICNVCRFDEYNLKYIKQEQKTHSLCPC